MSNSEPYIDFAISSIFITAFEDISAVGRINVFLDLCLIRKLILTLLYLLFSLQHLRTSVLWGESFQGQRKKREKNWYDGRSLGVLTLREDLCRE